MYYIICVGFAVCTVCITEGLPHPFTVCKPQGQVKYSYLVAHGAYDSHHSGVNQKCIQNCRWGKPEDKKPCVRPSSRWEDNIDIDLQEA